MNSQSVLVYSAPPTMCRGWSIWRGRMLRLVTFGFLVPAMLAIESHAAQTLNRTPGWPGTTLSGVPCWGSSTDSRFDYISERNRIGIVEKFHFYREIEQLTMHDGRLDNDLDYTLRSIPNHHRALWARARWYMRSLKNENKRDQLQRKERLREGNPPPECYFNRAKLFNPRDGMVSAIYGVYLHKRDAHEAALTEYKRAEEIIPQYAELIYNMGLLYLDIGNLDKAREYADKASALGHPLKGLRRRLNAATGEAERAASATN